LAGKLRGVPEFDRVEEFCREEQGLPEIPVATWGPLVFVHPAPNPTTSLLDLLSPLPEQTRNLGLEKMRFRQRKVYDLACNWKVYVDNYLDGGYHVNSLHKGLAGLIDYSKYKTDVYKFTSVQSSPLAPSSDPTVSKVRSGTAYYWWAFPNLMLNFYEGM